MASPNNSSKSEAKPSKPKEINNHFPEKKQEDLFKDRKRERRGEGPKWGQSYGQQVEKCKSLGQPPPKTVTFPLKHYVPLTF